MKDKMVGFPGFPAGKMPAVPLPTLFFTELLPLIDNLGELKVTLHLFWAIGMKQGALRYVRLSELLADERLLEGLASRRESGETVLRDGLERAVARGSVLHIRVDRAETSEDWYLINGPNGREVIEKLRTGELNVHIDEAEDVQLKLDRPNVFVLYEQNIGMLTPMIADELRDAEKNYPEQWIADALREAVTMNKRSWRYVVRILERWRAQGKDGGQLASKASEDSEARKRYYVPEGYEDLIEH
jgi:DnaD/phage-associated family protein